METLTLQGVLAGFDSLGVPAQNGEQLEEAGVRQQALLVHPPRESRERFAAAHRQGAGFSTGHTEAQFTGGEYRK